ncbi:hypothetical protein CSA08_02035 [Candidatus Gracilibacteria bacterium]|nr:MAG: hypothetical protein CSA08_02035 [Candidatus Gracilibacteria bacterium]
MYNDVSINNLLSNYFDSLNNPEKYQEINDNYRKLESFFSEYEDKHNDFLYLYLKLLRRDVKYGKILFGFMRRYEPDITKSFYKKLLSIDKEKNFQYDFVLDIWKKDQDRIENENLEKIKRYNKWKKENLEKHQEIIDEFNKILDKLETEVTK